MEIETTYDFVSEYAHGPLKEYRNQPFVIKGFFSSSELNIGYIGVTYAGKNQAIKELVFSLGGVYQERICPSCKRTREDGSIIYAESFEKNERVTHKIRLKSHAGDRIRKDTGPNAKNNIIVLKYLKSKGFLSQFNDIDEIINYEGIDISDTVGLITRIEDESLMTKMRRTQLNKYDFQKKYYVNNKNKRSYPLSALNCGNVDAVLDLLKKDNPTFKLVSFSNEDIPQNLEDKIVKFDNHLELDELTLETKKIFESFWFDCSDRNNIVKF